MRVRSYFVGLGMIVAMVASFAPFAQAQAPLQKIRISLSSRSNTNTTYYVAQARGLFKEEGLEVEFIQVNPRLGALAVLNGDVTFTTSFVSTFRGVVQGFPMKTVFILLKKGLYYLMVRPEIIKEPQDLKGKKLGVTAVNGGDHIIGRELLRMKGVDPNSVQAIAVGDPSLRLQAVVTGIVQAVSVPPPYDILLQNQGLKAISGPPEIGVPSSGLFVADKFIKENPLALRKTIRALLKANRFIEANRDETLRIMTQYVAQKIEYAARSYDVEFKALSKDGTMTDAEIEAQMERLADKKRPLDEIRDFSFARAALKELGN
ncbi:MAG: ABC transporter substrate-binding protein [Deltaproteobacteria bacterium]|nr:ABC transporter substrate-binding protein [Deltaproteobacteria bacterium]MBM4299761.1 ABC transporter substrate-binding protein [Deltaproteobacteria bacterium]